MRDSHLSRFLSDHPWAILEAHLFAIAEVVERHFLGEALSDDELQARLAGKQRAASEVAITKDGIAVLPLHGVIAPRMNLMTQVSGGTSTEQFGQAFTSLVDNPDVRGILIDVDSPGGSMYGFDELHARMMEARGKKPVVAHASPIAGSLAYGVASAADQIVVEPGGEVGSVGVFAIHREFSRQEENDGIKTTIVRSRKFKAEGNPHEPLSDESREALQARINEADERFYHAIALGRSLSKDAVDAGFGQGRLLTARQALKVGMVDRIATRAQTLKAMGSALPLPALSSQRAQGDQLPAAASLSCSVFDVRAELDMLGFRSV